ncbi:MAG TPA: hypothetical protein VIL51_11180 [Thermoleophilia bacterium]
MAATKPIAQTAEDVAMTGDRAFFERHPDAARYLRRRISGEFAPFAEDYAPLHEFGWVMVTALAPGVRARVPLSDDEIPGMS